MPFDQDTPPPYPPRVRRRQQSTGTGGVLLALLFGAVFGVGLLYVLTPGEPRFRAEPTDPTAAHREPVPPSDPHPEETRAIGLFKAVKDSVVNVDTVVRFRRLDMQVQEQQAGTGSGFVWDTEGRIVTNFHVVRQALANNLTIRVVMADRTAYNARIVGAAPDYDLAVLQIPAPKEKLKPITVGTSADLQVGQKAFAIGNPFGLSLTMTQGVISALDREIDSPGERPITGVIQTDAPINPGNSGGPLLDRDGRLIGVNTSIAGPIGGNVGIGFAIPVDTVNEVVTQVIRNGKVQQPDLGIRLVDQWRLRRAGYLEGVMVEQVDPDGPAAAAGLRGLDRDPRTGDVVPGDLILSLNGEDVRGNQEFARMVALLKVGAKASLAIERDGQRQTVEVSVRGV